MTLMQDRVRPWHRRPALGTHSGANCNTPSGPVGRRLAVPSLGGTQPMGGAAAESRRTGCSTDGARVDYPGGRPHFGAHQMAMANTRPVCQLTTAAWTTPSATPLDLGISSNSRRQIHLQWHPRAADQRFWNHESESWTEDSESRHASGPRACRRNVGTVHHVMSSNVEKGLCQLRNVCWLHLNQPIGRVRCRLTRLFKFKTQVC